MKITVLGGGAMGGLFGAYLSRCHEVTVIDVNPVLIDTINTEGLRIREPDGAVQTYRARAALSAAGMGRADLILVFVKAMYTESALRSNRELIGPDTCLMTLQNGSGHEDTLGKFVDAEHIVIGTTQHNANVSEPGVSNHGGSGMTYIGCVCGDVHRLQYLADAFAACGLAAEVSDGVQKMIWDKMFTNVTASALTGALQVPLGFIPRDAHAWALCQTLLREAVAAAAGLGMQFDYEQKLAGIRQVCDNSPEGLTSIYADLKNGRKTEVDTISGSIVRAGQKCGVPTPCHAFMVELIHAMENRAAPR